MIIIHTVYCVLGRTSSGKSTITQKAANNLNMKVLKSYTTRQRRENETDESCDHIFISSNEVEKYRNDMIAYTDRVGYCSFATKQQLLDNDFYIINPTGYYELKLKTKDMDIELVTMSDGLFIDDSARNLVTSNAKETICFGRTYSWNKDWTGKRLQNWAEIRQYLLGIGKEVTLEK